MSQRHSAEHQAAERARDNRAMMLNPDWWPIQFPRAQLAIKHRTITISGRPHDLPRTGRLVRDDDGAYLVFQFKDNNPFEMEDAATPFATVDDVLAAGWVVD